MERSGGGGQDAMVLSVPHQERSGAVIWKSVKCGLITPAMLSQLIDCQAENACDCVSHTCGYARFVHNNF
jgi:hypothetical protein